MIGYSRKYVEQDICESLVLLSAGGIDGYSHGKTDLQGVGFQFFGIEPDTDGKSLDDLDPVAGGVLRRNQGEGGAGTPGETVHDAVIDHR